MTPATDAATPTIHDVRPLWVLVVPPQHREHAWSSGIVRSDELERPTRRPEPSGRRPFGAMHWAALGTGIGMTAVGMIRGGQSIGPIFVTIGFGAVALALLLPTLDLLRRRRRVAPMTGVPLDASHGLVQELLDRYERAHAAADRRGVPPLAELAYSLVHSVAIRLDGRPPVFDGELDAVRGAIREIDEIIEGLD